jgi:hypothetical protein
MSGIKGRQARPFFVCGPFYVQFSLVEEAAAARFDVGALNAATACRTVLHDRYA